jgi:hypothetical protein
MIFLTSLMHFLGTMRKDTEVGYFTEWNLTKSDTPIPIEKVFFGNDFKVCDHFTLNETMFSNGLQNLPVGDIIRAIETILKNIYCFDTIPNNEKVSFNTPTNESLTPKETITINASTLQSGTDTSKPNEQITITNY